MRGATDLDIVRSALEGEYEVLRELGRGGMAVVYEARELMLDRKVALKVLPFTLAHDESLVERFQREAKMSAQLEHPHIIPIYRVGRTDSVIYFAMKLLRGLSLSDRLLEHGPLPASDTRRVLSETAEALGYAHRRGVVHRDVKPDNILLDGDGRCIVTDFGIARSVADSALTAAGTSLGTPRYMSPEQARAHHVDGRSDIYSLGVVGYQCLTGHVPFDGDDMMAILLSHVSKPVPHPPGLDAEQEALYAVIARMLAKKPEERFQTGEEVSAALTGPAALTRSAASTGGRATTRPTRSAGAGPGVHATTRRFESGEDALQPPDAFDRALEAGIGILRQQRPKVEAVLDAGHRVVEQQSPHIRTMVVRLSTAGRAAIAKVRSAAAADPRRFWSAVAGAAVLLVALPTAAHYAIDHRSRCPGVPAEGAALAGQSRAAPAAASFAVLVDEARSVGAGGDVEVYYDVCGLEKGTSYTTRITVTLQQSGLQKLIGGRVAPITASFEEKARGPATRRHRSFDLGGMPRGSYTVRVRVTDENKRRRSEGTSFWHGSE